MKPLSSIMWLRYNQLSTSALQFSASAKAYSFNIRVLHYMFYTIILHLKKKKEGIFAIKSAVTTSPREIWMMIGRSSQ